MRNFKDIFKYLVFVLLFIMAITSAFGQDSTYMQIRDGHWYTEVHPDALTTPIAILDSTDVVGPERVYNRLTGQTFIWSGVDSTWNEIILEDGLEDGVNLRAAYGEMEFADPDTILFAGGSVTPAQVDSFVVGDAYLFSVDTSAIAFNGTDTIMTRITYSLDATFPEAGNIRAHLRINGSEVTNSADKGEVTNPNSTASIFKSFLHRIAPGDVLEIFIAPPAHTGDDDMIISDADLNLFRID